MSEVIAVLQQYAEYKLVVSINFFLKSQELIWDIIILHNLSVLYHPMVSNHKTSPVTVWLVLIVLRMTSVSASQNHDIHFCLGMGTLTK